MSELYKDRNLNPEVRARALLEEMSVREKMAQLQCTWMINGYEDMMATGMQQGIGHYSTLFMKTVDTKEDCGEMQRNFQKIAIETGEHHIPAIAHMEALCGAFVPGATSFPSPIGRASSFDPENEEKMGKIISRQERAIGITQALAPVLDISRDSRLGRQGETYGEDPTLAAAMGSAFTKGLQADDGSGRRIDAVAKHFLAFHTSFGGVHGSNSEIGDRLMLEIYGKPFQAAIKEANLRGIMPCYNSINGEAASASSKIMTGILHEEMGFDGMVVSDYCAVNNLYEVQRVAETPTEAGILALKAGMDVELPMVQGYNEEMTRMFENGELDINILDRSVLRVLIGKFRMGLFEDAMAYTDERLQQAVSTAEDDKLAYQMARESLVLLKNDGILPLGFSNRNIEDSPKRKKKVALIGYHMKNARSYFGGYTLMATYEGSLATRSSMAGVLGTGEDLMKSLQMYPGSQVEISESKKFDDVLEKLYPDCKNLYEELSERLKDEYEVLYAYGYPCCGNDESYFEEALQAVRDADLVILTLGGKYGTSSISTMGEGVDATDIGLPECQERFLRLAAAEGKPMVGVHFNGRPVSSDAADECLNALLEAWSPSMWGGPAIADALTGVFAPCGKLPVSVAHNAGQIPVYYNHPYGAQTHQGSSVGFPEYVDCPHSPRYAFGHGVTYTTFEYSNLVVEGSGSCANGEIYVKPDDMLRISFQVKNTGSLEGTEITQLYFSDRYASMVRPAQELVGFARISLQPGEEREIHFEVAPSVIAFLDASMKWKIEKGFVDIKVGSSSADIRLQKCVRITEDKFIQGRDRMFYAIGR